MQSYVVATVEPDFLTNTRPWNISLNPETESTAGIYSTLQESLLRNQAKDWDNLTTTECIKRYSNSLSGARSVVLVLEDHTDTKQFPDNNLTALVDLNPRDPSLVWEQVWLCQGFDIPANHWCGPGGLLPNSTNFIYGWGPQRPDSDAVAAPDYAYTGRVAYCLSEGIAPVEEECGLHFSTSLMAIVCTLNLLKCACMLFVWWRLRRRTLPEERHLITFGDAVSSYLEIPAKDPDLDCGLTNAKDIDKVLTAGREGPQIWKTKTQSWAAAVRLREWITVFIPYTLIYLHVVHILM